MPGRDGASATCMGRILSRGCRKGPIHFLVRQFLCSTWQPFLRPDLSHPHRRRAQKRSKDGRVSAHRRLVLEGFEHDGTLERVGDDDVRGELLRGARMISCHILVCGGPKTQTMMQGYASAASSEAADPFCNTALKP
jgi:hypothetical protein